VWESGFTVFVSVRGHASVSGMEAKRDPEEDLLDPRSTNRAGREQGGRRDQTGGRRGGHRLPADFKDSEAHMSISATAVVKKETKVDPKEAER